MKAWTCIYALVFAAGMVAALADETNTTTQTGTTTNTPANTNEVAVPPPITPTPAPAPAAHKVKPPVVVPLAQTSAVPAPSNVSTAPLTTTNAITQPPMTTSTSAPAVSGDESLMQTGAVSAQSDVTDVTTAESSGIGRKGVLLISVAFLVVAGGLVVFLLRSSRKADHASLITRAMGESKDEDKDKHEDAKSPPPMT